MAASTDGRTLEVQHGERHTPSGIQAAHQRVGPNPHLVEEHLAEVHGAIDLPERPDIDPLR